MNPDDLAEAYAPSDEPPPPRGASSERGTWNRDHNTTQKLAFDEPAETVFLEGEKGTGKTIVGGDIIVRHAYENDDALVLVVSPSIRAGNEGIWHDLDTLVLPAWRDGNRYPLFIEQPDGQLIDHPHAGEYMDSGIGLNYTPSKLDPLTKDRHRWIQNMHGGWSKLLLMSIPHSSMVEDRIKGPAPSMVYVDELTNCNGPEYYTFPSAQLGRRRGIVGPQQYVATYNPKGPKHWVYKLKEEQKDDANFKVYKVPITENLHRLPRGYRERLMRLFKDNPTEYDRLINGLWVDVPSGESLFKDHFIQKIHVRGDPRKGVGLMPKKGFPIILGFDLGQVWNTCTFMQLLPTKEGKLLWLIFDEVDHLHQKILYRKMAREIIGRMKFWKARMDFDFQYEFIADESAINQWRPGGDGSYDAWDFEQEFNKEAETLGWKRKAKMIGCPKGDGTVGARVRMVQGKLVQEEMYVSATCVNTVDCLLFLESDEDGLPRRGKHVHKFDSFSYPMFKYELKGLRRSLDKAPVPTLIRCGGR